MAFNFLLHPISTLFPIILLVYASTKPVYAPATFLPGHPDRTYETSATVLLDSTADDDGTTGEYGMEETDDGQPTLPPHNDEDENDGVGTSGIKYHSPTVIADPDSSLEISELQELAAEAKARLTQALLAQPPTTGDADAFMSLDSTTTSYLMRRPFPGPMSGTVVTAMPPWLPPMHHIGHHHGGKSRFGPYFEEGAEGSNVTARLGSTVRLDCKIGMLQDKTVTWLHRKDDAIHLLTVGRQAYSSDSRFSLAYRYPNNWRLQILFVNSRDEGLYECQVATHPIRVRKVYLKVTAPELKIIDENRHEVLERYYKAGSEVELTCLATHLEEGDGLPELEEGSPNHKGTTTPASKPSSPRKGIPSSLKGVAGRVLWRHGDSAITHNSSGKGIGVRVSAGGRNVAVTLRLKSVTKEDGGNYTCSLGAISYATVSIHILNGT